MKRRGRKRLPVHRPEGSEPTAATVIPETVEPNAVPEASVPGAVKDGIAQKEAAPPPAPSKYEIPAGFGRAGRSNDAFGGKGAWEYTVCGPNGIQFMEKGPKTPRGKRPVIE